MSETVVLAALRSRYASNLEHRAAEVIESLMQRDTLLRSELANLQRIAIAGENGEISATDACNEIAVRLGHTVSRP